MTEAERIERLEQMVKTLANTLLRVTQAINTGSYEYNLSSVNFALGDVKEYPED